MLRALANSASVSQPRVTSALRLLSSTALQYKHHHHHHHQQQQYRWRSTGKAAGATAAAAGGGATAAIAAAGYVLNISKCVDKEHEGKTLREIIKLPPGALQGLKAGKADAMLQAFKIHTIEDLANWKHFRTARAILVLAATEVEGARPAGSVLNINGAVDKAYETKSLGEILAAPPSALQGLAEWSDSTLKDLRIKSVKDLGKWKYAVWADALTVLAAYERDDMGSR